MCKECGGTCGMKSKFIFRDEAKEIRNQTMTPEGFLQATVYLSRTGIQEYSANELGIFDRSPNERLKVWRPEKEVFKIQSMDSFYGKPVTDDHPSTLVDIDNVNQVMRGFVCDKITQEGIHTVSKITVTDKDLITKIKSGKTQVSAGYESNIVVEKGTTPQGEQYDAIQTDIVGNHVAIVDEGRCGESCKIQDHNIGAKKMSKYKKLIKLGDDSYMEEPMESEDLVSTLFRKVQELEAKIAGIDKGRENKGTNDIEESEGIQNRSEEKIINGKKDRKDKDPTFKATSEESEGIENRKGERVLEKKDRKDEGEHEYKATANGEHKYEADEEGEMEEAERRKSEDGDEEQVKEYTDEEKEEMKDEEEMDEEEKIEKKAEERAKVTDVAKKLIKNFDGRRKTILEIKKEVLRAKHPNLILDGRSTTHINASFDMLTIYHKDHLGDFDSHLSKLSKQQMTVHDTAGKSPRDGMKSYNANLYKLTPEVK